MLSVWYSQSMTQTNELRFANPQDEAEAALRFTMVEDRGDRVCVRLVCDMPIAPTFVYPASDLVNCQDGREAK
jgi:hypothetical protein